jgi:hypothetical protein
MRPCLGIKAKLWLDHSFQVWGPRATACWFRWMFPHVNTHTGEQLVRFCASTHNAAHIQRLAAVCKAVLALRQAYVTHSCVGTAQQYPGLLFGGVNPASPTRARCLANLRGAMHWKLTMVQYSLVLSELQHNVVAACWCTFSPPGMVIPAGLG